MDQRIKRPIPLVGSRSFGTNGKRRAQSDSREHGIEYMAAHVAESAGAEVESFAPFRRMIIALADKGARGADTKPKVPVEAHRHGVGGVGTRRRVAPGLGAPGVDFLDLADGATLDEP